ncbi:MAG: serine/threonine protein kinase, partial [Rhodocyclaceae bacterium]|nr:serine/threonine protein kinase [Rhodocyclaceae bacterium]
MAQYLMPAEGPAPALGDTVNTSTAPSSSGERGSSFGDYDLLGEIGRGGMGVVHRARQRGLDRIVALKMIIPSRLTSGTDLQRFRLEAETAARLDHPSILPIYEIGEISGQPYFTTKYLEGGSLARRISERQPGIDAKTANDQVRLFLKVCQAVAYAHDRGVLHRDLKPANILLDREGEPYVADFGLARLLEQESDLTLSQAMVGTPAYAAPEQLRGGSRHLTTAADVYSLGAVLYEMLSGQPPLRGPTTAETVRQVLDEDAKPLRALNAAVDRDLEAICRKCLEKDPRQRYANAGELTRELEHYLAGEPIQARPLDTVTLAWRWCRRRPAIASLIGAVAMAVLAVALVASLATWRISTARKAEQRESYYLNISLADSSIKGGDISRAKELLFSCPPEFRNWEWGYLLFRCHPEILSIDAHNDLVLTYRELYGCSPVARMQDLRWGTG